MIVGGFKADTGRADIENCLRKIMTNVDGVEKIQALGKFAVAVKVTFTDNDMMWAFIKANKNVKFKHEGEPWAILVLDRENTRRTSGSRQCAINRPRAS